MVVGAAKGNEGVVAVRYSIKVFGPFDLRAEDGRSIRPPVRKSCAILAVLALSDGHRQSRKWLQSLLWSESDEDRGAGSLRQELSRLKKLLGDAIGSDGIDIWLDPARFDFDHMAENTATAHEDLLQGMDLGDDAFEEWLRTQRQAHAARRVAITPGSRAHGGRGRCTVLFECDARGSLDAQAAAMFFSEQLFRRLTHHDVFTCIGHDSQGSDGHAGAVDRATVVVRISAIADQGEVCLGVRIDGGHLGPRLGDQTILLPHGMARLRESTQIGRLVQATADTLLEGLERGILPRGAAAEAAVLAHQAQKLTFRLDRASLNEADQLLSRAYALHPRGLYLGWRAFLRNTAFFQHRTSDIFDDGTGAEEFSLEAMRQAPEDALVQAFSAQLDYVNQGNLVAPLLKAQRAVEIDRSDPLARALLSNALTVNGRLSEGYEVALQSISLAAGSRYEFYFHHFACMAATAAKSYESAIGHARASVSYMPDFVSPRRYEVALARHLGDRRGLKRAVQAMRRMEPDFSVETLLDPTYPVNTLRRLPIIEAIA